MKFKDRKILECVQELDLVIKKRTLHKNGDVTLKYGPPQKYKDPKEQQAPSWFKEYEKKNDKRWLRQHNHNIKTREEIEKIKTDKTLKV